MSGRAVGGLAFSLVRGFSSTSCALGISRKSQRRLDKLHKHWAKDIFKPKVEWVDPLMGKGSVPFIERMRASILLPSRQVDLLDSEEVSRVQFLAEQAMKERLGADLAETVAESEARKREVFSRIVSLSNSNQQQAQNIALKFAQKEFERFPGDTGSSEVKAALKTVKIHFLAAHYKAAKKDFVARRRLEMLAHQRQKDLKYLRRTDPERYLWVTEKLGLSDEAVTHEFVLDAAYLWKTQFHGLRTIKPRPTMEEVKARKRFAVKKRRAVAYMVNRDPTFAEKAISHM